MVLGDWWITEQVNHIRSEQEVEEEMEIPE